VTDGWAVAQTWDPGTYDERCGFVASGGSQVLGWLDPQPGQRIVDLGCGSGALTLRLAEAGAQVIGLDSDPAMVEAAHRRLPGCEVRLADGHAFVVDPPADAVFSNAALHWMTRPAEVLRCVRDALHTQGRFVAELGGVGNVGAVESAADRAAAELGLEAPRWGHFFPTPGRYAQLLEDAGLEVRRLELVDRPTPLAGADGLAAWYAMFGVGALGHLSEAERGALVTRALELAKPSLHRDGVWYADYRRLRVLAVRS